MKGAIDVRTRKGNLLITVVIALFVALMSTSLLMFLNVQRAQVRHRVETAGTTESFIALANICADAFKYDLEMQHSRIALTSVEFPDGIEVSLDTYDSAVRSFQAALSSDGTYSSGEWEYCIHDPKALIEYAGITDRDFVKIIDSLLEDAAFSITVRNGLELSGSLSEDESITFNTGDELPIEDVLFTVVLEKGTTQVIQEYRLSGEKLYARYGGSMLSLSVDSADAANTMESQLITRNNSNQTIS